MRLCPVVVSVTAALSADAFAADRLVPSAYPTVTAALAAATPGDRILLAAGTQTEAAIAFNKNVTLVGAGSSATTLQGTGNPILTVNAGVTLTLTDLKLDGQNARRGAIVSGTLVARDAVITRGTANDGSGVQVAAGARFEPTNVVFSLNKGTGWGGAISATGGATVVVLGSTFTDNDSTSGGPARGGAIYGGNATLTVSNSTFTNNDALYGGAIHAYQGNVSIRDSRFESNGSASRGGAMYIWYHTSFSLIRNVFCKNTIATGWTGVDEGDGGAVFLREGPGTITNNVFFGNTANDEGGGLAYYGPGTSEISNNTFVANDAVNNGAGLWVTGGTANAKNNLVIYQATPAAVEREGGTFNLSYTWFYNNLGANTTGTITASNNTTGTDPQIAGYVANDCTVSRLYPKYGSPLIGAGDPTLLDPDNSRSDIGAFGGPSADPALWTDGDTDGVVRLWDCNDADNTISPAKSEVCDALDVDEDCDSVADNADASVTGKSSLFVDADGDGHGNPASPVTACPATGYAALGDDCNDADATTFATTTWYRDADKDGHGTPLDVASACSAPVGYDDDSNDCDDTDATANIDLTWYEDVDADGYGNTGATKLACRQPARYAALPGDCNDADSKINPLTVWYYDTDGDGLGSTKSVTQCVQIPGTVLTGGDCDDGTATTKGPTDWWLDVDGDTWGTGAPVNQCPPGAGWASRSGDCNDADPAQRPGATFYKDADLDGQGSVTDTTTACSPPVGYVVSSTDCNDGDKNIRVGGTEVCDAANVDEDCDKLADDADPTTNVSGTGTNFWVDADSDGHGDSKAASKRTCDLPSGYAKVNDDCNDTDALVSPTAPEQCNSKDDDCDNVVDDGVKDVSWYLDGDDDGYGGGTATVDCKTPGPGWVLLDGDCADADANRFPGALEFCNSLDEDCDTVLDNDPVDGTTYWPDVDNDGYGDDLGAKSSCTAPAGYVDQDGDCEDDNSDVSPDADELCNGDDDDCDDAVDEDPIDPTPWFFDEDGDGFGAGSATDACDPPEDFVVADGDCDDANAQVHPDADEVCENAIDDDCDPGTIDLCGDTGVGRPYEPLVDTDVAPAIGEACGCNNSRQAGFWLPLFGLLALRARRRRASPHDATVNRHGGC